MRAIRLLLCLAVPVAGPVMLAVLLGVATVASAVGLMGTAAFLICTAALQPSIAELHVAIAGVRFFGLARGVFRYGERLVSHRTALAMLERLRSWFFAALEPLAPARLLDRRSGDLVARAVSDVEILEGFAARVLVATMVAMLVAVGSASFLAWHHPPSAVIFTVCYSLSLIVLPAFVWRRAARNAESRAAARAVFSAGVVEYFQGLAELRVFGRADERRKELESEVSALARAARRKGASEAWSTASSLLLQHGAVVAVLMVGVPAVREGVIDGVVLAVLALVVLASFEAAAVLPEAARSLCDHLASAGRLLEILDAEPAVHEPDDPRCPDWLKGVGASPELRFEAVSFSYPDGTLGLVNLDLLVRPGSRVAVVGPSGAGKSTMVQVLLRFWDPQSGRICVEGEDIRALPLDQLRQAVGVVAQRTELFAGTVAENLRLARPEATEAELLEACRVAEIHDTIERLPEGYGTWIGERGRQLSGGERQRLAVARVVLQQPRLLILDEPTAHLDAGTGHRLIESLERAAGERTIIHITHQLRRMERYDQILVLDRGRLVEQGTHLELVRERRLYRRMWEAQRNLLS